MLGFDYRVTVGEQNIQVAACTALPKDYLSTKSPDRTVRLSYNFCLHCSISDFVLIGTFFYSTDIKLGLYMHNFWIRNLNRSLPKFFLMWCTINFMIIHHFWNEVPLFPHYQIFIIPFNCASTIFTKFRYKVKQLFQNVDITSNIYIDITCTMSKMGCYGPTILLLLSF